MTQVYYQNLTPWRGERINEARLPANIGSVWSDEDLAAVGLYRAYPPAEVPQGKRLSANVEWDGSGVRYVLEDDPPAERRRVDKWTIVERVNAVGKAAAADALLNAPGNEFAKFRWLAPVESVYFDDPDTVAMITALGLDPDEIMAP